jgi:hypothetical protein
LLLVVALPAPAAHRWEMQSNFWVSLHHTLLDAAQNGKKADESLPPSDRTNWTNALLIYRIRFGDRVPWENEELTRINDMLSGMSGDMIEEGLPEEVARALLLAAPAYRRVYWPADEKSNQFWISAAEGLLRDAGEELAAEHARVYGVPYPQKIRVDVSPWAGQAGVYTTDANGFVHTTISSREPGYRGFASLEMLVHEPTHAILSPSTGIGAQMTAIGTEKRLLVPRNLWHAILFYTSGELTRRALQARGITDYVPYAHSKGLYDRTFTGLKQPLETYWQFYLDGRMSRDAAIVALVENTGTVPPSRTAR